MDIFPATQSESTPTIPDASVADCRPEDIHRSEEPWAGVPALASSQNTQGPVAQMADAGQGTALTAMTGRKQPCVVRHAHVAGSTPAGASTNNESGVCGSLNEQADGGSGGSKPWRKEVVDAPGATTARRETLAENPIPPSAPLDLPPVALGYMDDEYLHLPNAYNNTASNESLRDWFSDHWLYVVGLLIGACAFVVAAWIGAN